MRRIIAVFCVCSILLSLTACQTNVTPSSSQQSTTTADTGKLSGEEYSKVYGLIYKYIHTKTKTPDFKENQTVPIDTLMEYFRVFCLDDSNGNTVEQWKPYEKKEYVFEIPKRKVKEVLEKKFAVKVDDSKSTYAKGSLLKVGVATRDVGPLVSLDSFNITGNRIIVNGSIAALSFPTESEPNVKEGYVPESLFEICIENFTTDQFKYIYYKSEKWEME